MPSWVVYFGILQVRWKGQIGCIFVLHVFPHVHFTVNNALFNCHSVLVVVVVVVVVVANNPGNFSLKEGQALHRCTMLNALIAGWFQKIIGCSIKRVSL